MRSPTAFVSLSSLFATLLVASAVHAQPRPAQPSLNLGRSIGIRFENAAEDNAGQTKLVMSNVLIDARVEGPFTMTLEQGGRVLAWANCAFRTDNARGLGLLYMSEECGTPYIPSASIRTDQPVEIALSLVNQATDARTDLYRGSFPVYGFSNWLGTDNDDQNIQVEQRALRLDSFYGAAFARDDANKVQFSFVDTTHANEVPDVAARCRVGTGEWRAYSGSVFVASAQTVRNRVWIGDGLREDGDETIVTQFAEISLDLPVSVTGGTRRPTAGASMDGAWTCELRSGGGPTRTVLRELRFNVRGGLIQPSAIDAQMAPGRGVVLVSVGMNPEAMPVLFDPALVRDTVAGRRLSGATSLFVSPMPARALNPQLSAPPRAAAAQAGRGGRGRRR